MAMLIKDVLGVCLFNCPSLLLHVCIREEIIETDLSLFQYYSYLCMTFAMLQLYCQLKTLRIYTHCTHSINDPQNYVCTYVQ